MGCGGSVHGDPLPLPLISEDAPKTRQTYGNGPPVEKKKSFIKDKDEGTPRKPKSKLVRKISDLTGVQPLPPRRERSRHHTWVHQKMTPTQKVIRGNVKVECPSTAKIVRIFTSSTFTDTRHERNALMERVYPRLKESCQQRGYEFQVVDMRWGIRDEATDDHMTTDLCLREVDLCKKLSTGPYFVTFLSHKYGYRDFPNKIEANEFDILTAGISGYTKELLNKWFKRDDNSVPPTYVLQPISSVLPDFRSEDEDKRKEAKNSWNAHCSTMQDALVQEAKKKLSDKDAHRFQMSVTEAEITRGVSGSEEKAMNYCLWFHRRINNLEEQEPNYTLSRYKDCTRNQDNYKISQESQELLQKLRDKRLPKLIDPGNHHKYSVKWSQTGIDPAGSKDHASYIDKLCKEFEQHVTNMVEVAIEARKKSDLANPLYGEIVEHTIFCQSKCKAFHGRHFTLDLLTQYLKGNSQTPFIVHGPSGCGKTSIVAMTANLALQVLTEKTGIVIRFLGTTPDSTSIGALLQSVISQIWRIYGIVESDLPADIKDLTEIFHKALSEASESEPLVLLLDSLDQLDPAGGARQLSWLPKKLPEHVKMVVSTLPEAEYESFPALKGIFKDKSNYLNVPKLNDEDVDGILGKWLEVNKRCLTKEQMKIVLKTFQKCPLPLFLKISFDRACRWSSFSSPSQTILEDSIRGSIDALFTRMEDLHGKIFVSKALSYLTLSKSGLTESELEDILSCDDDVLNDVYTYWTPPIRRLPPLLLVRLKGDLGQYLVDRGADGVKVFFWYHRQFIEAATDKYCGDPKINQEMNASLADFFSGTWANGKLKPYVDGNGKHDSADRKVASQPDRFDTGYNLRKLNNLPHHRIEARQRTLLKEECLLNFTFLHKKLQASGLGPILDDFMAARSVFPDDEQLRTVSECLQLSQDALITYPNELPSQLLGRIRNKESLKDLLDQCWKADECFLMPNKPILIPPGGQLIHCLAYHKGDIQGIAMTADSKRAITSSSDKSVKVWDVDRGKLMRSFDQLGEDPDKIVLCCNESTFLVHVDNCILAYRMDTMSLAYRVAIEDTKRPFCVGGENDSQLLVFTETSVTMYSASNGELIADIKCPYVTDNFEICDYGACIGSERYAAISDTDQHYVFIFDFKERKFVNKKLIYKKFKDKEGEEDQHTIDAMVFSHSGDKLYISNMYTNDLQIYNTGTMEQEKVVSGDEHDSSDKFRFSGDGTMVYFANSNNVVVWDLKKMRRSVILAQSSSFSDVVLHDMKRAVTISDDQVVRIWDLTREPKEEEEEEGDKEDAKILLSEDEDEEKKSGDVSEKKKSKSFSIRDMKTMSNPRYILLTMSRSGTHYIQIRDLELDRVVRQFKLSVSPSAVCPLKNCTEVVFKLGRRVKKVDLVTEEVTTFQGLTAAHGPSQVLVQDGKEAIVPSRGRMNLKVYTVSTGKVAAILKTNNKKRYDELRAGMKGNIAVGGTDEGPCFVFDIAKRTFLHSISGSDVGVEDTLYINDALVSNDGQYFIFQAEKLPAKAAEEDKKEYILFCWDIEKNCLHRELVDMELYRKYVAEDDDRDVGVDVFKLLDNKTLVANHNDSYIRIFDLTSGEMKKRIDGHQSCEICTDKDSPYFLSFGQYSEDNAIRIFNRETFERIATFCPDYDMRKASLCSDGHHVVGHFREYKHPVMWSVMGQSSMTSQKPLSEYPLIYGTSVIKSKLTLGGADDKIAEPGDPDTDVDEPESEDDDSDDDLDIPDDLDLDLDNLDLDDLDMDNLDLGDLDTDDLDSKT